MEILTTILAGLLSSIIGNWASSLARRSKTPDESIAERISKLTAALEASSRSISQIQSEVESRRKLAEKLQNDIQTYTELSALKKSETEAVVQVMRGEIRRESNRSFWQQVIVNFFFFILGAGLSWWLR